MSSNTQLTDEQLLKEIKRRLDENAANLIEERKLTAQLNEVNEKLIISEQLKSNFLSNIRNEINNPISSILELSKNISEGDLTDETIKSLATLIHAEAFDLDFQLRNIFLSAEIEAGESPLSVISVRVFHMMESLIQQFEKKIAKKGLQFEWKNSVSETQILRTDAEKLHLIISNLFANAIQFNKEEGRVTIETSFENDALTVVVKDTGIGISDDQKEKIYDRFYQIEAGSTKTYGGHGLGLCITKALLEVIEGSIHLESKLGEGTAFTIVVPSLEMSNSEEDTFSMDGNDFLFENDEDDMLF
jgi:signal transduction histidine kinase